MIELRSVLFPQAPFRQNPSRRNHCTARPFTRRTQLMETQMLDKLFYYGKTLAESGLAIFGIGVLLEHPRYTVRETLGHDVEIRDYGPVMAASVTIGAPTRNQAAEEAFRTLFAYITGNNSSRETIAMTTPVQQQPSGELIPMTSPVSIASPEGDAPNELTMRFFLPAKYGDNPPQPADPRVHLVKDPAMTVAAIRFSGNPTDTARREKTHELMETLAPTQWKSVGQPWLLGYDPPFAIPFLKRNEIAVQVTLNSH
jgi:hypothetical protein